MAQQNLNRICTICARGGSKGLPSKNIKMMLGVPLIVHTINQAKKSGLFTAICVTSDADDILAIARQAGVAFAIKRPAEMASDSAAKFPAIMHAIAEVERQSSEFFDIVVDMDPTSPLRFVRDIHAAVSMLEEDPEVENILTGCSARRSPYFNLVERDAAGQVTLSKRLDGPILRRQDSPECFDLNASIYAWRRQSFFKKPGVFYPATRLYEMPFERSIDIDSAVEFALVEFLARERGGLLL